jgi:hypothetical protein
LSVLVLVVVVAEVNAAGIRFRNDMKIPIIVQGTTVIKPGMARKGPPVLLKTGQTGWDPNLPVGNRLITIYDANQPNRVLFQTTVLVGPKDVPVRVQPIYAKDGSLQGGQLVPDNAK